MRVFVSGETAGLRHSGNVERLVIDAPAPADRVCVGGTEIRSQQTQWKEASKN